MLPFLFGYHFHRTSPQLTKLIVLTEKFYGCVAVPVKEHPKDSGSDAVMAALSFEDVRVSGSNL